VRRWEEEFFLKISLFPGSTKFASACRPAVWLTVSLDLFIYFLFYF